MWFGRDPPKLEQALKVGARAAEEGCMMITIPCAACTRDKRPLASCPSCAGRGPAEQEMATWRGLLHAVHATRITAEPRRAPAPAGARIRPIRVSVVVTGDEDGATVEPIAVPESGLPAHDPLSFDWDEPRGFRLRKSA
jgi:hypothetical protein